MSRVTLHSLFPRFSSAVLALAMILTLALSACNVPTPPPAATLTGPIAAASPTTAPANQVTAAAQPTTAAQPTEAAPTQSPTDSGASSNNEQSAPSVTVNVSGVAQSVDSQVAPAVTAESGAPWFEVMPQHAVLTLQGYPVTNNRKTAQIFVYPVNGLSGNQNAAEAVTRLQQLLQNQPTGEAISLPYLPLESSVKQAVLAQRSYLDFKNGKGMRYLTEWHNGLSPIDNQNLLYTFQGLTSDGKYYVAAVLPVNMQGLPEDMNDTSRLPADWQTNYTKYLADTTSLLNQNPTSSYTPDLTALDAMMQSIEVK